MRRFAPWVALAVTAGILLLEVTVTPPRIAIRWRGEVDDAARGALERRYGLGDGERDPDTATTWRYTLDDDSPARIRALVTDPAVEDTANIDRQAMTAPDPAVRVRLRPLPGPLRVAIEEAPRFHRSLWLLLAGALLLAAARAPALAARRGVAVAVLLLSGAIMIARPLEPAFVKMGESRERASRAGFEQYFDGRIRFEKHLSHVILLERYRQRGPAATAAEQALADMGRLAAGWFVLTGIALGIAEGWSAVALRYLGLALLAPAALLYFGWREFAYLSLNVMTFPLLVRGLRTGGRELEGAAALAGFGAALHGAGLVSLAGVWLAALGADSTLRERAGRALRVAAWGTAAYLGWVLFYEVLLHLPLQPGSGRPMWRPYFAERLVEGRLTPPVASALGLRDIAVQAWIAGAPLLAVAASIGRRVPLEWRAALWYLPPSLLFLVHRWPFAGVGPGMDLVIAGFPALYALAWICAHDSRRTAAAAALLASAHALFWFVVLDPRFEVVFVE